MGHINRKKIITLILCLLITGIICNLRPVTKTVKKTISLEKALADISGWHYDGFNSLDSKIVDALYLDDYANQSYTKNRETVSLYIGYYLTKKKVGAAHDPMVCFPGQGWLIQDKKAERLILNSKTGEKVSYSSMIAKRSGEKELVIYWFQSYDTTTRDTFTQKITLLWNRLFKKGEDNAFVRITMQVDEKSIPECKKTIHEFIKAFYPVFLEYIQNG